MDVRDPAEIRRVVVFGAGAIGSLIGGKLAKVLPVALVGRTGHIQAIRDHGLRLEGLSNETIACGERMAAVEMLAQVAPPLGNGDAVILAVKAAQAADAARTLSTVVAAHQVDPPIPLYSLQNGTGFESALRSALSPSFAFRHAVVHLGATYTDPGRVEEWGGEILLPDDSSSISLVHALKQSGLGARNLPDLEIWRWKKIAFNCALNALSGIWDVRNRETIVDALKPLRRAVLREVREEAAALGVHLSGTDELLAEFERRALASNNVNSLLQDLCRGRPTEIGYLNEAILSSARSAGRETLANGTIAEWVRRLERARNEDERADIRTRAQTELLALAGDPGLR